MNATRGRKETRAATPSSRVSNPDEGFTEPGDPAFVPFSHGVEPAIASPGPFLSDHSETLSGGSATAATSKLRVPFPAMHAASVAATDATAQQPSPRECDCPDWFVRCAHWQGELVFLGDRRRLHWVNGMPADVDASPWRVWRLLPTDLLARKLLNHTVSTPHSCLYAGDSEADALAAFYDAEQQLLATAPRGSLPDAAQAARCPAVANESASFATQRTPAAEGSTPSAPALGVNVSHLTQERNRQSR
jgi:hypothetical protein